MREKNKRKNKTIMVISSMIIVSICGVISCQFMKKGNLNEREITEKAIQGQNLINTSSNSQNDQEIKQYQHLLSTFGFGYEDNEDILFEYRNWTSEKLAIEDAKRSRKYY